jgi:hypothetical protein
MRTTPRDPDDWATPPRVPRHAAPPLRLPAPHRLVARLRTGPLRAGGKFGAVELLRPVAAYGPATPAGMGARRALRLFTAVGVGAAGLLLLSGFLVLMVSGGGSPTRTSPLASDSSLASNGHSATRGGDGDRKSGGPLTAPRSVGYSRPAGHSVRAGAGKHDRRAGPSRSSRPIASFAGNGDMITSRFAVDASTDWQIAWSYRCPTSVQVGLLVVEDAASGEVGPPSAAISASGTAGHGDTWLDPDGRSHRLVVISSCPWTMKVIQNS